MSSPVLFWWVQIKDQVASSFLLFIFFHYCSSTSYTLVQCMTCPYTLGVLAPSVNFLAGTVFIPASLVAVYFCDQLAYHCSFFFLNKKQNKTGDCQCN